MNGATLPARIEAVRRFSRFYTNLLGVLNDGLLATPYSLTEARVIFEMAQAALSDVATLRKSLNLDSGYLSRILSRFEQDGLVERQQSSVDARRQSIRLTDVGREAFRSLDARSIDQVSRMLSRLPEAEQRELVEALEFVRRTLGDEQTATTIVLRGLSAGDLGWVVQRHGEVYAREYGWDETFEALVARIVADYVENLLPSREYAWIAELHGERAGCVFCVRKDDEIAQLRILLVEPWARGRGIGARLVDECLRFATQAGYKQITLWTNDILQSARRIYEAAGFELVKEERHCSFGKELVGQFWSRAL